MWASKRKALLPMRITRLLLPKLEFIVEVYWNPIKIKFESNLFIKSGDFWVSRKSWSLLGRYTAATHRGRRSWRLQDCPTLKMETLWPFMESASNRQGGTTHTTWITVWQGRRFWMLMTLFFWQLSFEGTTIMRPKFHKFLGKFHMNHVLAASETYTETTQFK